MKGMSDRLDLAGGLMPAPAYIVLGSSPVSQGIPGSQNPYAPYIPGHMQPMAMFGGGSGTPRQPASPAPTPTQQAGGNQDAPPKQGATPKSSAPSGANYGYAPQAPQAGAAPTAPTASAAPVAPTLQTSGFPQRGAATAVAAPLERTSPVNPLHAAIQRQVAPQGMQAGVFRQDPRLSFGGLNQ